MLLNGTVNAENYFSVVVLCRLVLAMKILACNYLGFATSLSYKYFDDPENKVVFDFFDLGGFYDLLNELYCKFDLRKMIFLCLRVDVFLYGFVSALLFDSCFDLPDFSDFRSPKILWTYFLVVRKTKNPPLGTCVGYVVLYVSKACCPAMLYMCLGTYGNTYRRVC